MMAQIILKGTAHVCNVHKYNVQTREVFPEGQQFDAGGTAAGSKMARAIDLPMFRQDVAIGVKVCCCAKVGPAVRNAVQRHFA